MRKGGGRVRQAVVVEGGRTRLELALRDGRGPVLTRGEAAAHMAGPNAQGEHDRHIARLGELKRLLHTTHEVGQVWARVEQAQRRLHGKGMGTLLNHARALAVVLAHHNERATEHARRGQVGERIGGHVGADNGFPRHRAPHRVHDGGRQHGRSRRFVGTGFDVHAELIQIGARLHHHIE